jgi:hypothetical protein
MGTPDGPLPWNTRPRDGGVRRFRQSGSVSPRILKGLAERVRRVLDIGRAGGQSRLLRDFAARHHLARSRPPQAGLGRCQHRRESDLESVTGRSQDALAAQPQDHRPRRRASRDVRSTRGDRFGNRAIDYRGSPEKPRSPRRNHRRSVSSAFRCSSRRERLAAASQFAPKLLGGQTTSSSFNPIFRQSKKGIQCRAHSSWPYLQSLSFTR